MAFDTKAFLTEAGFTEAEIAELGPKFTDTHSKKLEGMVLRQPDYSRQMNELGKAKTDLNAANERLTAEIAEWASQQAKTGETSAKQQKALADAEQKALKAEQALRSLATQAGLDPEQVLAGITPVAPPKAPEAQQPDLSGYVKTTDLGQTLRSMMHLPAVLMTLANEHQQLFGAPLDTQAVIAELETRAATRGNTKSLDPKTIWEELH